MMEITFEFASLPELAWLENAEKDHHITSAMLERKIRQQEVILAKKQDKIIGWLRFGFFWDEIPFLNMLEIEKSFQKQGIGNSLVKYWESEMRKRNYSRVLTSSLASENAQHFYRKLGYSDIGSLILPDEPLEIIFLKKI